MAGEAPRGALGLSPLRHPLACASRWAQLCLLGHPAGLCFTRNAGRDIAPGLWFTDPDLILDQHFLHVDKVQHVTLAAPSEHGSHQGGECHLPAREGAAPCRQQGSPRRAGDGRAALGCAGNPGSQRW